MKRKAPRDDATVVLVALAVAAAFAFVVYAITGSFYAMLCVASTVLAVLLVVAD